MKKTIYIIIMFSLILFSAGISAAQSQSMESIHTDMTRAMLNENLSKLSVLLAKMSDALDGGDMKPDHQVVCAEILMKVSQMMLEMTGPSDKTTYGKHQTQIEKLEKKWNPWEEMVEH